MARHEMCVFLSMFISLEDLQEEESEKSVVLNWETSSLCSLQNLVQISQTPCCEGLVKTRSSVRKRRAERLKLRKRAKHEMRSKGRGEGG